MNNGIQTEGARAVIYCRVSTDEQGQTGQSLDVQEKLCAKWCEVNGVTVIKNGIYRDDFTGTKLSRPDFSRMVLRLADEAESGTPVSYVVGYDTSRFTRGSNLESVKSMVAPALLVFALNSTVYDDNEMTEIGTAISNFLDKQQVKKIRKNTVNALKEKKDKGYHVGRPSPFAIRDDLHLMPIGKIHEEPYIVKDDKTGMIRERSGAVVKNLTELWLLADQGYSLEQVAKEWNVGYGTLHGYLDGSKYAVKLPKRLEEYKRRYKLARANGAKGPTKKKVSETSPSETPLETGETVSERIGVGKVGENPSNGPETNVGKDGVE